MAKRFKRWTLGVGIIGALVFGAAGTWHDPWLWAYVGLWGLTTAFPLFSIDEDLAKERFHPPTGGADHTALNLVRIVALSHLLVGAADSGRWHVTTPPPEWLRGAALAAMGISFGMFYRAMRENRFFSSVVRVQAERGHHVIDSGPYRIVRHPGYAGLLVAVPFSGIALGSWLAVALGLVMSGLILRRVMFEDAFLQKNLDGYAAYAHRVPHRVIPGVW